MSVEMPVNEDHDVLGSEFCSGYTDALGRWNPGFYCPSGEASDALLCCGGSTYKYCCTMREHATEEELGNLPLILGAALGVTAALAIIILVSCCCCSCCSLYKVRHSQKQDNNGPVYRMQCSSTTSGVANMYSFSNQNSLATTPIDSAASQILVELEPDGAGSGGGRTGTMARGNTFSRDNPSTRTLQRNGRVGSSPQLDRHRDAPPPYDATKPPAALHKPGAHHTLPHQRHHHQQQQPHQAHQQYHQQQLYQPQNLLPPECDQSRQHFTLPRSHHATVQSARSPITTFPHGGFHPMTTATLNRGPRASPVPVPVVGPPPCSGRPPMGPTSPTQHSPVNSPHHGFQTHTLRRDPGPGYGMTHSHSSTFNPGPPQPTLQSLPPPPNMPAPGAPITNGPTQPSNGGPGPILHNHHHMQHPMPSSLSHGQIISVQDHAVPAPGQILAIPHVPQDHSNATPEALYRSTKF